MALGPGTILKGKYRIERRLGSGGMGTVWQGVDLDLGREVAIKVMLSDKNDPESFQRFQREARVAANLQHPGITVVHEFGRDQDQVFIVMELLRGTDLGALLRQNPRGLPAERVVRLATHAADALSEAHANRVVHRDIKPANLFVLADDRLKICDFGIAKWDAATSPLTKSNQVLGSFPYMSPEQWKSEPVDARSDLYSLGCVLYAMLSGRPPFGEGHDLPSLMNQHLRETPVRPRGIDTTPRALEDLVMRLLAKDPQHRPATAAEVAKELRRISFDRSQPQGKPGYQSGYAPTQDVRPEPATQEGVVILPEPSLPAARYLPPFSRTTGILAFVVFLTTTVICFSPLWRMGSAQWLLLEIPGAVAGVVGCGLSLDLESVTARHPGWQLFAASLGFCAAEAGLILFATGTLLPVISAVIGVAGFTAGFLMLTLLDNSKLRPEQSDKK